MLSVLGVLQKLKEYSSVESGKDFSGEHHGRHSDLHRKIIIMMIVCINNTSSYMYNAYYIHLLVKERYVY